LAITIGVTTQTHMDHYIGFHPALYNFILSIHIKGKFLTISSTRS
jgi:hypothetical protein